MNAYTTVNEVLVGLFKEILEQEEKALITDEFKDITGNDMHIIEAIGYDEEKNMSTVASLLKVTVGTLTIAINNLVKKGYVIRARGDKDRRVVLISLSAKGKSAYLNHEKFHKEMTEAIIKRLEPKEVDVLVKALKELSIFFNIS